MEITPQHQSIVMLSIYHTENNISIIFRTLQEFQYPFVLIAILDFFRWLAQKPAASVNLASFNQSLEKVFATPVWKVNKYGIKNI